jgi:hypothetical protein
LPSKAEKERWKRLAEKAKSNLSEFCISIIEERLAEEDGIIPRREIAKELETLKAGKQDPSRRSQAIKRWFCKELRQSCGVTGRSRYLQNDYIGVRPYSEELAKVIKARWPAREQSAQFVGREFVL